MGDVDLEICSWGNKQSRNLSFPLAPPDPLAKRITYTPHNLVTQKKPHPRNYTGTIVTLSITCCIEISNKQ